MANILAIETSSVYCSIGISKNKEIFFEHSKEENSHGKLIFKFIDNLLKKAKLKKEDIDFIALSIGPGSFTGLRVGCSVAQGLALGLEKKILPISSLKILAQNIFLSDLLQDLYIVQEAHMNDLYLGSFQRKKNDLAFSKEKDISIKKTSLKDLISPDCQEIICTNCQDLFSYLNKKYLMNESTHVKGLMYLANFFDDLEENLCAPENVYPSYLSGSDQWIKVK